MYGYILSLTHSEYYAEEITQEISIKIRIFRDLLAKAGNLEHYLFTMARNRIISFYGSSSRQGAVAAFGVADEVILTRSRYIPTYHMRRPILT